MTDNKKLLKQVLKKGTIIFLMIAFLTEKRSPPLMKVHLRKMHHIEFKICVIAGNGSRVVVTTQIFFFISVE